jgi:hypothetical protein
MKPVITSILIILTAIQSLGSAAVYLQFAINRDYVAKVLCINKSKPALHCKGKCQLSKRLQEEGKTEDSSEYDGKRFQLQELIINEPFVLSTSTLSSDRAPNFFHTSHMITGWLPALFRPPRS